MVFGDSYLSYLLVSAWRQSQQGSQGPRIAYRQGPRQPLIPKVTHWVFTTGLEPPQHGYAKSDDLAKPGHSGLERWQRSLLISPLGREPSDSLSLLPHLSP